MMQSPNNSLPSHLVARKLSQDEIDANERKDRLRHTLNNFLWRELKDLQYKRIAKEVQPTFDETLPIEENFITARRLCAGRFPSSYLDKNTSGGEQYKACLVASLFPKRFLDCDKNSLEECMNFNMDETELLAKRGPFNA
ncbi:ribosomal protein L9 [Acrasis kona]|uniref:Ribosomal protein L9 n=1 Tax=Acrasis kona TaxID=1008807 RepID=A0AAW2YW49_9EUKA